MSEIVHASLEDVSKMKFTANTKSGHSVVMDALPKVGGEDVGPRPAEMPFVGLAGCTGMDVVSLLDKMRVGIDDFKIIVQAELPKEESAEKMTHGKSGLKPPQGLAEPAGIRQPASGNGSAAETISHDTSNQAESSQGIYGSASENFKLGLAASERNEYDIALEYFNKVAMALPKVPSSFLNMADLHYRMKNYQTARKHAERALELGANSAHRILSKIEESLAEKKKEEPEPAFDS